MKTLLKKLKVVDSVQCWKYEIALKVYSLIKNGKAEVLSASDNYNIAEWKSWQTYGNCIQSTFCLDGGNLICNIRVYDGDCLDGKPIGVRWKAKIKLPIEFLVNIEKLINNTLLYHVDDLYLQFLADQKEAWIEDKIIELLED
jgi:hypothetical protein